MDRFERFSIAISEISRHWHKLTGEEMEKHGLKAFHGIFLLVLSHYEEGLTSPQICDLCARDKSDVSRLMRILEEKEIVTKDGEHQNRYGGVFRLTEQGKAIVEQLRIRANLAVEYAGSGLTDRQREEFYDALDSISEKIRELSKEGMPES